MNLYLIYYFSSVLSKKIHIFSMKRIVLLFGLCVLMSQNVFASDWAINDKSHTLKILKYQGSAVAELKYNGKWYFYCEKGRKRGRAGEKYDSLRTATKFAMSECDKF